MRALILVDIQNDFCPGGALAVPDGDQVVRVANDLREKCDISIATQDWHPANHRSFASVSKVPLFTIFDLNGQQQMAWPDHCIQGSEGAKLHKDLIPPAEIFQKGMNPDIDSYSGFFDNGGTGDTGLHKRLTLLGSKELVICGLATDYCVKYTVLDALKLGYNVYVVQNGCRAVSPNNEMASFKEMFAAGAFMLSHDTLL